MYFNKISRKKLFLITLTLFCVVYFTLFSSFGLTAQLFYYFYPKQGIHCYHVKSDSLKDISEISPIKGKSIFFHETSCNSYFNGKISVTPRQACAVESAARLNPNFDVYLLFTSPGVFMFEDTENDRVLQALLTYKNIRIHHLDYDKYTAGTPVEKLYKSGKIDQSEYAQSHASDVLRYLTLWKFGGIYLDLDVVVIKTLEYLPENYAGAESEQNVAAGILSFSPTGHGHELAEICLNDLKEHFDGHNWGSNGPGVITRLLKDKCGVNQASEMLTKKCQGFTVYPTETFYAVPWWNWTMYFDDKSTKAVFDMSEKSYIIHVWNKHSTHSKIDVNSQTQVPYALYAKQFCPKVFSECKEYF